MTSTVVPSRQVRPAADEDCGALQALYSECRELAEWLPEPARASSDFARDTEGERILVAIGASGVLEGFVSVWEPDSFIHHLYVHPQSRAQGVAIGLLASLKSLPFPWRLKCLRSNAGALGFYANLGWVECGRGDGDEGPYLVLQLQSWPLKRGSC